MSNRLTDNIRLLLKDLIKHLSGFEENSEEFKVTEKFVHSHVDSYHYFFNDNRKDIEKCIDGLAEKFHFHGFVRQAVDLKKCASKFFDTAHVKEDLDVRLAIVKLLLELSESPTSYFTENPDEFKIRFKDVEEEIDWPNFLKDTKVPFKDSYVEESFSEEEYWSGSESEIQNEKIQKVHNYEDEPDIKINNTDIKLIDFSSTLNTITDQGVSDKRNIDPKVNIVKEANKAKEELMNTIQTVWWNKEQICEKPKSEMDQAEVAIRWEDFVNHVTMGLYSPKTNIINEYKVMREVVWQFFTPHSCFSFNLDENAIVPKENMSIASVRPVPFKNFLNTFVPYFAMLKTFRDFQNSILGEYFTPSIPDTYRSYNCAIQDILKPVFEKVREIEDIIRKQESTYTLLTLAKDLRPHFQKVEFLHQIHHELMNEFSEVDDSYASTTYLLSRLYYGLLNSSTKNEQNIFLTLYLESLYKYFTIIETWLTQDLLEDISDEFIIVDVSKSTLFNKSQINEEFNAKNLEKFSKNDGMLNIISTIVLQLGKNTHLLRQLGKLHLIINEHGENYESLHHEYCRTVLEEINKYLIKPNDLNKEKNLNDKLAVQENFESVFICPDTPKSSSGMDSLANYVDVSDGFLMTVFENYILPENPKVKIQEQNLYEKIDNNIDRIVPVWQILESIFKDVLKKRYSVPGLMVKDILITQFELKKHFSLIRRLFLFEDDIIFPFYKKMFAQFEDNQPWGNFFWLTSQIQDLLMDHYPDFYELCRVDVSQNWRLCVNPLDAWDMISVHYRIEWPVSLIIQQGHLTQYHELFQFLLKVKWAMYTLNRLNFSDIQPRSKNYKSISPVHRLRIRRLQLMRFRLLNDVSSVQHYILGHLFSSVLRTFNKDLELCYDLETLIESHNKFINSLYIFCQKLRDYDSESYGFAKVLILAMQLQNMWKNINNLSDTHLKNCEKEYLLCNKYLRPIIEVDVLF